MQKFLFTDVPLVDRPGILEANAARIEKGFVYNRNLDEDEIAVFKDIFADTSIELSKLKKELDALKEKYKAEMKPIDQKIASILDIISTRQTSECGTVYLIPEESEKIMGYYDNRGELIHSRRLTPEEQTPGKLSVSHLKEGTNN